MQLRKLHFMKAAVALSLTVLVAVGSGTAAFASTMLEAKGQQSALETQKKENEKKVSKLEQNVQDKKGYVLTLKEEQKELRASIDSQNSSIVQLDKVLQEAKIKESQETLDFMQAGRARLEAEKESYSQQLAELDLLLEEAYKLVAEANQDEKAAKAEAERIAKEKKETDEAIDAWYAEYKEAQKNSGVSTDNLGGSVYAAKGMFLWPTPGYTDITQYYGDSGHRGIDIAGSGIYGKAIVAAAEGTVAYSGEMGTYGYVVFIDHGNGYQTWYAHMSALGCEVGDTVAANQVIGYVGSTGNSTGPHLHFEVLYDGILCDPFDYF